MHSIHCFINPTEKEYKDEYVKLSDGKYSVLFHGQPKQTRDHYLLKNDVPRYVYYGRSGKIRRFLGRVIHAQLLNGECIPNKYWLIVEPTEAITNEDGIAVCETEMYAEQPMPRSMTLTGPFKKLTAMQFVGVPYEKIRDISFFEGIVPVY